MVLRQLNRRVGPLATAQQQAIEALAPDDLRTLGEALLEFTAAGDLDAWLTGR